MPIFGITASSNQTIKLTDFESIATINVTSNVASVEFTSIPQTYTHLQIRSFSRVNSGDSYQIFAQFNGDTGSNYSYHYLYGPGNSAAMLSGNTLNQTQMSGIGSSPGSTTGGSIFGASVCDILDYTNTNKFTTARAISGAERQATPTYVFMPSGHWRSTAAITSIKLLSEGAASFVQYSSFALYGVRA